MLQRIQTVYLLLIVALMIATLFLPLAVLQNTDQLMTFDATGISMMNNGEVELVYPTWGLFALAAIVSLIALVSIFLFRNRMLQIRLSVFNALLMFGFYGLFIFFFWTIKGQSGTELVSVKIALSFPLISLILDYLAIRNIGADETLVRSLDRLR